MSIRPAIKDDCAAIAEIYNHAVVHTAAIWNDKTVDTDNRIAWFEARQLAGFPVLVSEETASSPVIPPLATGARLTAFATPWSIRCTFTPSTRGKVWAANFWSP